MMNGVIRTRALRRAVIIVPCILIVSVLFSTYQPPSQRRVQQTGSIATTKEPFDRLACRWFAICGLNRIKPDEARDTLLKLDAHVHWYIEA